MIILVFAMFFEILTAPPNKTLCIFEGERINPYIRILKAITDIESSNGVILLNKKENAVGWFGIRPIRLNDYNIKTGKHITLKQCYDYEIGKMICMYYISQVDYRDIKGVAVAWNGKSKENKYYQKLKNKL
jgi:hypothetical protein